MLKRRNGVARLIFEKVASIKCRARVNKLKVALI